MSQFDEAENESPFAEGIPCVEAKATPTWVKMLPTFLRKKIEPRPQLQKITINVGWLLLDKALRMGVGLLVGVWTARYLGPEQFGKWNYAIAFGFLFGAFASLGVDGIVIRNLVQNPEQRDKLLGTAFFLKLVGGITAMTLAVGGMAFFQNGDSSTTVLVLLSSLGFVFQASLSVDLLFQAKNENKRTVIAQNAAFLVATVFKVFLLVTKASLFAFACAGTLESFLGAAFIFMMYQQRYGKIFSWSVDFSLAKRILHESWPLVLAASMSLLNMRMDQVFIGKMLNNGSVGSYSAAVKIAEIWLMIPTMFGQVIFPMIVGAKQQGEVIYRQKIFKIFRIMTGVAIPVATLVSIFSTQIILLLYGKSFEAAGSILAIQIWTGAPSLMFFVFGQVFYVEKLIRYHLIAAIFQPISNIALNLLLIPIYGTKGAAIATLITSFGSHIITMAILEIKVKFFSRGFRKGALTT